MCVVQTKMMKSLDVGIRMVTQKCFSTNGQNRTSDRSGTGQLKMEMSRAPR